MALEEAVTHRLYGPVRETPVAIFVDIYLSLNILTIDTARTFLVTIPVEGEVLLDTDRVLGKVPRPIVGRVGFLVQPEHILIFDGLLTARGDEFAVKVVSCTATDAQEAVGVGKGASDE